MTTDSEDAPPDDPVDAILDRLLDLPAAEARSALDEVCSAQPQHAERLRRRWSSLASLGLLPGDDSEASGQAIPERLGPFRLLERLGGGGMGVVYRARQDGLQRDVAVKVVRPEMAFFDQSRARFRREAEAVAQLAHPGIVPVHAFGEVQGISYLAMELVDGVPLDQVIARLMQTPAAARGADAIAAIAGCDPERLGRSHVECCVRIVLAIADALAHAHARGVLHRDVKPSNVMLDRDGRARLLDFGLAAKEGAERLTRTGMQLGSLQYSSPEQVRSAQVDARGDLWSLGAVLYELVTLRPPFAGASTSALTHAILSRDPPRVARVAPGTPADLEAIVLRALEKDPVRRYPDAAAFAADLRAFLEFRPVQARRLTPLHRLVRFARREPLRAGLFAVLALGIPLLAGLSLYIAANRGYTEAGRRAELHAWIERVVAEGFAHLANEATGAAERAFLAARALDAGDREVGLGLRLVASAKDGIERTLPTAQEREAVDRDAPTDVATLFELAMRAVYAGGRRDDAASLHFALDMLQRAEDRAPAARALLHQQHAEIAGWLGDAEAARRSALALQSLWPDDAMTWYASGRALLTVDPERAVDCFRRARTLRPDLPHVAGNLALALRAAGHLDEAVVDFEEAIALDPASPIVHINYGETLLARGEPQRARDQFERAVALSPAHPGARYDLGVALVALGERDAARAAFKATVERAPAYAEAWNNLGSLQLEASDGTAAIASFTRFTELRGDDAMSWKNLALAHWQAEHWRPAIEALRRAAALAPGDGEVHDQLVQLLQHVGDQDGLTAEQARYAAAQGKR
ncbi:MAG: protein kinase [Planctomycetota bacterium]